ncbi:MAG: glycoside hydrolase family 2 [Gemmatimonadota bacterium]|nr:glycoside hydrolase family 2 [Gemmatimonadota bacterium]
MVNPPQKIAIRRVLLGATLLSSLSSPLHAQAVVRLSGAEMPIPLPEHPRPDFQRPDWRNLNGTWQFKFDGTNRGENERWFAGALAAPHAIRVPFSWGAPLSGVTDSADIGWYQRSIQIPASWRGKRVFLVVGASDWRTSVWLDGAKVGEHQGGYTPFSVELTRSARYGSDQRVTLRVDDTPHPFKLEGKQGYGKARGLWQTVYLEARGSDPLQYVHFTPDITRGRVVVDAHLSDPAPSDVSVRVAFRRGEDSLTSMETALPTAVEQRVARGQSHVRLEIPMPIARLWSPDDPHLYSVTATVSGAGVVTDSVNSYFGMREISVVNLPGTSIPYVALNGKPIYLQLSLDQAYHPQGFYTFPTDSILRNEILQARQIGLTGLREHIKIEAPRKLYWADRLGVLMMADVPNWWGPPDSVSFAEHDYAMREMIERDYNHPSIFSWVTYNEAWGIVSKVNGKDVYTPATQQSVIRSVRLAKQLDPTRLVEDNSPCCGRGHTETDLNSWHEYLPGFDWERRVSIISDSTFPGSPWNFEKGYAQKQQPMFNSEFGDVWGYKGSSGDVDWSWDYHLAVNAFRRHPKLSGWLYTELDDVINEWNGYWRADRTKKETGMGELVDGMTLNDLHAPFYVVVGSELGTHARAGETVQVPLYASFLTDSRAHGDSLTLKFELYGWNALGERKTWSTSSRRIAYHPWMAEALAPQSVIMPNETAVAVLTTRLEDASGAVLQRNFTTFVVNGAASSEMRNAEGHRVVVARVSPSSYSASKWSLKSWTVMDSLKVDGAGSGFVEYRIPWPAGLKVGDVAEASFIVEASAKRLLGKDRDTTAKDNGDYMRGGGLQDPSRNRNAYPMTGETAYPSAVRVQVNGEPSGRYTLADDPADHRGILSWTSQLRDGYLREAGSYGQLVRVPLSPAALAKAAHDGAVVVRLQVDAATPGGLAIYGAHFGRYPVDPSVAFVLR